MLINTFGILVVFGHLVKKKENFILKITFF